MNNLTCKICSKEFTNIRGLSNHIRIHNINPYDYSLKYNYNNKIPLCKCGCKQPTKFISIGKGFNEYIFHHKNKTKTIIKKCLYCNKEFESNIKENRIYCSLKCRSSCNIQKEKYKITNLKKYGVDNVFKHKDFIKNNIKYMNKNYGGIGLSSPIIKEKVTKTLQKKYNVDNVSKIPNIINKITKTMSERYGGMGMGSNIIKKKIQKTNNKLYGVNCIFQNKDINKKTKQTFLINSYKTITSSKRLNDKSIALFTVNEYVGVRHKYKFKCKRCNNIFISDLKNKIPLCPICYPKKYNKPETEIYEFLYNELKIQNINRNTKTIITPYELDIYLPDYKIAIEHNGLHWHGELNGKDKNYHLNKTKLCEKQGIQLIHIFGNEWLDKQDIVKSIIRNKLKLNTTKIYARKCIIKNVSSFDYSLFLVDNHIQTSISSKIKLGLYYNNQLIMLLSFSKPRFNKKYEYELIRSVTKINHTVIGGFNKLLSYFIKQYNPTSIISYVNRRYFNGISYIQNKNFKQLKKSNPSYWYIINETLHNRVQYQKHKLKNKLNTFDSTLTEWENMKLNGYDRIWDCGNLIFVYNKKPQLLI